MHVRYTLKLGTPLSNIRSGRVSVDSSKVQDLSVAQKSTTVAQKGAQNFMKAGAGSEINQLIISTLEDRNKLPKERLKSLRAIIEQKRGLLNHVHAATMLQRCARGKLDITEAISLVALREILMKSSHRKLRSVEAAHSLYGLRLLDSNTKSIMPFLTTITDLVLNCQEPFKGQEIANALYGLQRFKSDSPEIRKLLIALETKLISPAVQLSPQEISNALYGEIMLLLITPYKL